MRHLSVCVGLPVSLYFGARLNLFWRQGPPTGTFRGRSATSEEPEAARGTLASRRDGPHRFARRGLRLSGIYLALRAFASFSVERGSGKCLSGWAKEGKQPFICLIFSHLFFARAHLERG